MEGKINMNNSCRHSFSFPRVSVDFDLEVLNFNLWNKVEQKLHELVIITAHFHQLTEPDLSVLFEACLYMRVMLQPHGGEVQFSFVEVQTDTCFLPLLETAGNGSLYALTPACMYVITFRHKISQPSCKSRQLPALRGCAHISSEAQYLHNEALV